MKTIQRRVFILGAALVLGPFCQGQGSQMGDTNAGTALAISGTVFDAAGAPAAGVRLEVVSGPGTNLEVRSGDDGKYALTWQKFNPANGAMPVLFARDLERNAALLQDIDETTTNLDLHLKPGLTITVKAEDGNGIPISHRHGILDILCWRQGFSF